MVTETFWETEVDSISKKGNSVEIVQDIRKKLSKEKQSMEELNNFGKI